MKTIRLLGELLKEFPGWLWNEWPYLVAKRIRDKAEEIRQWALGDISSDEWLDRDNSND